jgi:hypothetical protein
MDRFKSQATPRREWSQWEAHRQEITWMKRQMLFFTITAGAVGFLIGYLVSAYGV